MYRREIDPHTTEQTRKTRPNQQKTTPKTWNCAKRINRTMRLLCTVSVEKKDTFILRWNVIENLMRPLRTPVHVMATPMHKMPKSQIISDVMEEIWKRNISIEQQKHDSSTMKLLIISRKQPFTRTDEVSHHKPGQETEWIIRLQGQSWHVPKQVLLVPNPEVYSWNRKEEPVGMGTKETATRSGKAFKKRVPT